MINGFIGLEHTNSAVIVFLFCSHQKMLSLKSLGRTDVHMSRWTMYNIQRTVRKFLHQYLEKMRPSPSERTVVLCFDPCFFDHSFVWFENHWRKVSQFRKKCYLISHNFLWTVDFSSGFLLLNGLTTRDFLHWSGHTFELCADRKDLKPWSQNTNAIALVSLVTMNKCLTWKQMRAENQLNLQHCTLLYTSFCNHWTAEGGCSHCFLTCINLQVTEEPRSRHRVVSKDGVKAIGLFSRSQLLLSTHFLHSCHK